MALGKILGLLKKGEIGNVRYGGLRETDSKNGICVNAIWSQHW